MYTLYICTFNIVVAPKCQPEHGPLTDPPLINVNPSILSFNVLEQHS